jgi:small subunit ribosomal protein S14
MKKVKSIQQRRDIERRRLADQYRRTRAYIKATSINMMRSPEERVGAAQELRKINNNSSHVRVVNRCVETGRGRSVMRMFRRSRYVVRDRMRNGELPGFTKAS